MDRGFVVTSIDGALPAMQHRRPVFVAAFIGLFLIKLGGCARSEMNLQRQSRENERPNSLVARPGVQVPKSHASAYRAEPTSTGLAAPAMNAMRPMPKRLPRTNQSADEKLVEEAIDGGRLPRTRGDGSSDELVDSGLDAAFQRLHEAREKMPRRSPAATSREVPPPATRLASPFAKTEQHRSGSVR